MLHQRTFTTHEYITDNKEMNQKMQDKYQFLKEVFDLKETFSYN